MGDSFRFTGLSGNLTRDVELRHTSGGVAIGKVGIACSGRKKVQGEWQDYPHFFDLVLFGSHAERLAQHAKKGSSIWVESRPAQDRWTDKESGHKRSKVEFEVTNWGFIGGREKQQSPDVTIIDESELGF